MMTKKGQRQIGQTTDNEQKRTYTTFVNINGNGFREKSFLLSNDNR
jgi:hypothetical protein